MHTSTNLKQIGAIPFGVDNINSYYDINLKLMRIAKLKSLNIDFKKLDLCDSEALSGLLKEHKFDYVLHLAAQAGVRFSIKNPKAYVKSNIECFVNLMESFVQLKQRPIVVYASSSSVYGKNIKVPFTENQKITSQRSVYGATKAADELLAHVYHDMYGFKMTGLRFFTVYGTYGRPDMAYFSFAERIMKGTKLKLFNHGNMDRDFTHVSDIVDGIVSSLALGAEFEVFNLGRGSVRNVKELVSFLESELEKKALVENVPTPGGEVLMTFANTDHAKESLCYFPKVDLEQGIAEFVKWYKEVWLTRARDH